MCFAKNFQYPLVTKKKKRKVSNASILFHFKHWTVLDYCPWQRITFGAIFESLTFFPSNSGNDVILFMPLAQNISTLETSTEDYVELSSTSMIKFLSFLPFLQTSVVNTFIVCLKSITCSFIYPDSPEYIKYCLIMRE